jgi:hypothetical protein
MGIPVGRRLYPYPTHNLTGRIWVLAMGIKVCPYLAHVGTVPAGIAFYTRSPLGA